MQVKAEKIQYKGKFSRLCGCPIHNDIEKVESNHLYSLKGNHRKVKKIFAKNLIAKGLIRSKTSWICKDCLHTLQKPEDINVKSEDSDESNGNDDSKDVTDQALENMCREIGARILTLIRTDIKNILKNQKKFTIEELINHSTSHWINDRPVI